MKKHGMWLRRLAGLLLAGLLLGAVTVSADTAQEGCFILSAVADGRVIIAPERVTYTAEQTVQEALAASGHTFTGLKDGMVTAIDGVSASFSRSDQSGGYELASPASGVTHYCFATGDATPSAARQNLMTAMADYLAEDVDVQSAAKEQYQAALTAYPHATDTGFDGCTKDLTNAIEAYKAELNGTAYTVTFSGHSGKRIEAINAHGKVYTTTGSSALSLPAGNYTFSVTDGMYRVSGSIDVSGNLTVTAALPTGQWLKTEVLQVATAPYNDKNETQFSENLLKTTWESSTCTVQVPDTVTDWLYFYLEHNCETTPTLTVLYTDTNGKTVESGALAFQSYKSGMSKVLATGVQGNTVTLRLSQTGTDGYTQSMDYTLNLVRTPTLKGLTVENQSNAVQGADSVFAPLTNAYTYQVSSKTTAVKVTPQAFDEDYTVTVNGQRLTDGSVTVTLSGDTTVISVVVSCGSQTATYTLTVIKSESCTVTVQADPGVTVQMYNSYGDTLDFTTQRGANTVNYIYDLVKGQSYTYVATKDTWYHEKRTFTVTKDTTMKVDINTQDWLEALALGTGTAVSMKGKIPLETAFSAANHSYTAVLADKTNAVAIWAEAATNQTVQALYTSLSAATASKERTYSLTSGISEGKYLQDLLIANNARGNTLTVRVSEENNGITQYQDYQITLRRALSLDDLTVACGGDSIPLYQGLTEKTGYDAGQTAYTVTVPVAATALELTAPVKAKTARYGDTDHGYQVTVNGQEIAEDGKTTVTLSGTTEPETVTIQITNPYAPGNETTITLLVQKAAPVYTTVKLSPESALLAVYERTSGNRVWPEDGVYMLSDGFTYDYLLTANGYVGQSGAITVTKDDDGKAVVQVGENIVKTTTDTADRVTATLTMTMTQAAKNTSLKTDISSYWSSFRRDGSNNGVVDVKTPFAAEDSTLYWATQIGQGYGDGAVGCPILVEGDLVVYAGTKICRIDATSGEIIATGDMIDKSSFAINTPTYADGMIFVGLSNGRVQAFDAATLESLWVYQDPLEGQPNSTLVVHNGYLYTGFWNSETKNANFVCLPIADEDPTQKTENKTAAWRWTQKGGFYWAGAYVCDDYLLVGTDDGESGYTSQTSSLLMLDPKTGKLLDRLDGLNADIRSSICYDTVTQAFYFTSKGGSFYSVKVSGNKLTDLWSVDLGDMSTSTPVVYNGRAYVGVSGTGQFVQYSGHRIAVIDLANKAIAYTVTTKGYPQTSGLLTTAYGEYVYVYFMDNYTPGTMRVLRDKAGQTSADLITVENGCNAAYALFTPFGGQAQYCICSPIADENGVLYFKNDSGYLMAFGPAVEKLTVTAQPTRTAYVERDTFDPAGMKITATLKNGKTLDVTDCVTWDEDALALGTTSVTVSYRPMYHNEPSGSSMKAGVDTISSTVEVPITVTAASDPATAITGATISGGTVTVHLNGAVQSEWKILVAIYDETGKMVSIQQATVSGATATAAVSVTGGAKVKVFVLGESQQPAMKNWEGTIG